MSLLDQAANQHQAQQQAAVEAALPAFKKLLKEKFGIDTDPQSTRIVVDGTTIDYLNPRELSVHRACPVCGITIATDGVQSLEHLGQEIASRPFPAHTCKPVKPTPPPGKKTK